MASYPAFNIMYVMFFLMLFVPTSIAATQAKREQIALDFTVHEIQSGPNATLLMASGTGGMGTVTVFDNTVHEGENPDTKLLGRATGSGMVTTLDGMNGGLQIQSQISFGEGSMYNGSSILFTGTVFTPMVPWEVVVVGGTGYFRGIRGYAYVEPGTSSPPVDTFKWSVRAWKWTKQV
ncbi:hypothetical protein KC19_5G177900 [Ceratodon purpureus]|uniref:Dirigent protein n=1 Tax=Ceratodon purpureus TaxID=3225 RepID=A0A8T0I2R7_CERPU|nr:hypothetical protein KC19_5G177900 [Ceratodon purpureus]